MKNNGKQFEKIVREQLESLHGVSVDRINDNVGFKGAYNIADLIVYRYPCQYYIECKTIRGTSFPFSNINENALRDMQFKSIFHGVGCYFLIWFVDLDKTIAVPSSEIYLAMYLKGKKSIGVSSFDEYEYITVDGTKKRKYYNYNMDKLLNDMEREVLWLK